MVIEDGQLLKGTIDAEAVGAFKGKITDRIIKEYSPSVASEFLDQDDPARACEASCMLDFPSA